MENIHKENQACKKLLKYALAMSIIRNKPPSMSAKNYTELLHRKLNTSETTWRAKAKKLEKELEKTRNEIALMHLKQASIEGRYAEDVVTESVQPIQDSHKTTSSNEKFFFSVIAIQHWAAILKTNHSVFSTLKQNLIKVLSDFEESVRKVVNNTQVSFTIPTMSLLKDILKEERVFKDEQVLHACIRVIESLVRCVLTEEKLQDDQIEGLIEVLDEISVSCAPVRDVVLEKYILLVSGYTSVLKGIDNILCIDSVKYDRFYFVCSSLHMITTTTLNKWPCQRLEDHERLLEKDLFSVSGKFPLYAHSVWNVLSDMTDCRSS